MNDNNGLGQVIFGKKTFSALLKDIYNTTISTEKKIEDLINSLVPLIETPSQAVMIVPLIKDYLDVQIKNNEHLVKMAAIVQRAIQNSQKNAEGDIILSDSEKEQLLQSVRDLHSDKIKKLELNHDKIKNNS